MCLLLSLFLGLSPRKDSIEGGFDWKEEEKGMKHNRYERRLESDRSLKDYPPVYIQQGKHLSLKLILNRDPFHVETQIRPF